MATIVPCLPDIDEFADSCPLPTGRGAAISAAIRDDGGVVMIYSSLFIYLQCLSYLILSSGSQADSTKCLIVVIHLLFTLHVLSLLSLTSNLYLDPHL